MKPVLLFVPLQEQDRNLDIPFMTSHAYRDGSDIEDADATEAYIVVAVGRIVVVPIRNGAVVGIVVPATAAFHTVRPAC